MKKFNVSFKYINESYESNNSVKVDDNLYAFVDFDEKFTKDMFIKSNMHTVLLDVLYESRYNYGVVCIDEEFNKTYESIYADSTNYIYELKHICNGGINNFAKVDKVIIVHNLLMDSLDEYYRFECVILSIDEISEELNKERTISIYTGDRDIDLKYSFADAFISCDIESDIFDNNLLVNPRITLNIHKKESDRYEVSHLHEEDE